MKGCFLVLLLLASYCQAEDLLPNDPVVLQSLVEKGDHQAMTKLGYFYFTGTNVEKDQGEALELYIRASGKGNMQAKNNLCNMYLYGDGVEKNVYQAWIQCLESARSGRSSSMVMLAEMAESKEIQPSFGTSEKSIAFALEMYKEAASRGHIQAQYMLAYFYEIGKGTPKNLAKAKEWYKKSAEQGNPDATTALNELKN